MSTECIAGQGDVLLLCDHASNAVPAGIDLGIAPDLLALHIAYDIGAADLTRALAARLDAAAILGGVSRLVVDLNRLPGDPAIAPGGSDGQAIPGNVGADIAARIAAFHTPYHGTIARRIAAHPPSLIVAIHSFTPRLAGGAARPWQVGILHGPHGCRAAPHALAFLAGEGLTVGDNEPYSGIHFNATLDRHAVGSIDALNVEVRNDLLGTPEGVARWCDIIARMIDHVRNRLALQGRSAT